MLNNDSTKEKKIINILKSQTEKKSWSAKLKHKGGEISSAKFTQDASKFKLKENEKKDRALTNEDIQKIYNEFNRRCYEKTHIEQELLILLSGSRGLCALRNEIIKCVEHGNNAELSFLIFMFREKQAEMEKWLSQWDAIVALDSRWVRVIDTQKQAYLLRPYQDYKLCKELSAFGNTLDMLKRDESIYGAGLSSWANLYGITIDTKKKASQLEEEILDEGQEDR